jgi:phospholipase/lecithinase/hemolysin
MASATMLLLVARAEATSAANPILLNETQNVMVFGDSYSANVYQVSRTLIFTVLFLHLIVELFVL